MEGSEKGHVSLEKEADESQKSENRIKIKREMDESNYKDINLAEMEIKID